MLSRFSPVQEIANGREYDVTAADGEVIGTQVPAWVARVIAACDGPVLVRAYQCAGVSPPGTKTAPQAR
jgi:hypothetical protein